MQIGAYAKTPARPAGVPAVPAGAYALHSHGLELLLLPGRAVWWPLAHMLLVADLHLGKASTFRRAGLPVPSGTTQNNLQRLTCLLAQTNARHLVFLGDLLHARSGADAALWTAVAQWRGLHPSVALTLVRGNHDWHAGDPPASLGITLVDEPWQPLPDAPLFGCHHPQSVAGGLVLAGHLHPTAQLYGTGRDRLRVPCFVLHDGQLVLPAFGAFTGGMASTASPSARRFAVVEQQVLAIAPRAASG